MGVTLAIQLREALQRFLDQQLPLVTPEDEHDRLYAVCEALSTEVARHILRVNPGLTVALAEGSYVRTRVSSLATEMLFPFTADALRRELATGPRLKVRES